MGFPAIAMMKRSMPQRNISERRARRLEHRHHGRGVRGRLHGRGHDCAPQPRARPRQRPACGQRRAGSGSDLSSWRLRIVLSERYTSEWAAVTRFYSPSGPLNGQPTARPGSGAAPTAGAASIVHFAAKAHLSATASCGVFVRLQAMRAAHPKPAPPQQLRAQEAMRRA